MGKVGEISVSIRTGLFLISLCLVSWGRCGEKWEFGELGRPESWKVLRVGRSRQLGGVESWEVQKVGRCGELESWEVWTARKS